MLAKIHQENIKIQVFVLVVGFLLFIIKFITFFLTNSVLVLSDALESIVNLIAGAIGLYSLNLSSVPKDNNHPYGHGKVEFLTSGIEGSLIFFAGLMIIYESTERLRFPSSIQKLDFGWFLIITTSLVYGFLGFYVKNKGIIKRNLQLISSGQHLITDAISTIAVSIGMLIIFFTNFIWLDSILGILVGVYILFPSYGIIRSAIAGIMDESDKELILQFIDLMKNNKKDSWIDFHNLKILKNGSVIHVDVHLTLPYYWTVQQASREILNIERLIKNEFGEMAECSIQIDACTENFCQFCTINDCNVRKMPLLYAWKWDYDQITHLHE